MKTYVNLWQCLAEFVLEREIFETKVVEKTKTHILSFFFHKDIAFFWGYVEMYGRDRQATDDNIKRRIRFACWITKTTDTRIM